LELLADRYELAETLGAGGMARVVAAYDRRLRRRVAIKLVREELTADPTSRERLLREARAAAGLQHPNTVAVHDVGEQDGQAYIVLELVEGGTLADRVRERGRLPAAEVVAIGGAVLAALQAAHERGLVHRDVKPANVLLPAAGGVKLADFGIAKALDAVTPDLTATGQVLGTPRYLAPEQVAGRPATPASDLYSLGAVLYECLAGEPPFDAETAIAVALAHQQQPVPPLAERAVDAPVALTRAIERALAKDPEQRPADAARMREDLLAAVADAGDVAVASGGTRPLESAPTDPDEQAWFAPREGRSSWLARNRWVAAIAVVLVGAGLVALLTGDETPEGDGARPVAEGDTESDDAEADDTETDAAPQGPADLDDLAADLARDPEAAGERGRKLLEELLSLREESGSDRREDARELIEDVAEWLADDKLDPQVGGLAVRLLELEGRPPDAGLAPVSALFAEVAVDKVGWGEKAKDLLSDLDDLLGEEDAEDRAEDARDLVEEIEKWISEEKLDASHGQEAIRVLQPVADEGA
jgi:eukaryotic-like serine/threonine-protein kinase